MEKLRIYLETSIVERYFKRAILARKKGKREFKRPFILDLLVNQKGTSIYNKIIYDKKLIEDLLPVPCDDPV